MAKKKVELRKTITVDLKSTAMTYGVVALRTLVDICRRGDSDSARVAAANSILDRGYGKARQSIEHTGANGGPIQTISTTMTDQEAAEAYASTLHSSSK